MTMKYLLGYLEGISDAPSLTDPDFQQLLVDVQAGKPQIRTNDAFYESLEKVVAELRSSPESGPFQRPVSKREAPDYYDIVKKPMDLQTLSKNIKAHKYRSKAEFASDLDLMWSNCALYNHELHPIRGQARFLKQKADHHLEFLADRNERPANPILPLLPPTSSASPAPSAHYLKPSTSGRGFTPGVSSSLRGVSVIAGEEEDAPGESDDGTGDRGSVKDEGLRVTDEAGPSRGASRERRATSVASIAREGSVGSNFRNSATSFRPKLQTTLESAPALIRTAQSMTPQLSDPLSRDPGGSGGWWEDKGKAKETLLETPAPSWYVAGNDEDSRAEGSWWSVLGKDEAYVAGMPSTPSMTISTSPHRTRSTTRRKSLMNGNGALVYSPDPPPSLVPPKPVSLPHLIHSTVEKLYDTRQLATQITEFQRAEQDGNILPRYDDGESERLLRREEASERKRKKRIEREEAVKRRKTGGEVGEREAALRLKKASAAMLAHVGFEGASENTLDLFTKVATDHIRNMGRTFRLLVDRFSQKMTAEELVLHSLFESDERELFHLEGHIKDEIEAKALKVASEKRRFRQAYKDVTTAPAIEDDMLFADNGEMLLDGNFAEELGEDFLGLRDLGIAQEYGMRSLAVPSSIFYGRRKRMADGAAGGKKEDGPDFPPPPPWIPLTPAIVQHHVPALLHAFFANRQEQGLGLADDAEFDHAHASIGSLGQIVSKSQYSINMKKKKDAALANGHGHVNGEKKAGGGGVGGGGGGGGGEGAVKKKKKPSTGVGRGNWIRPSKEEKAAKREADRQAALSMANGGATPGSEDALGEEEDAEGEEE